MSINVSPFSRFVESTIEENISTQDAEVRDWCDWDADAPDDGRYDEWGRLPPFNSDRERFNCNQ